MDQVGGGMENGNVRWGTEDGVGGNFLHTV